MFVFSFDIFLLNGTNVTIFFKPRNSERTEGKTGLSTEVRLGMKGFVERENLCVKSMSTF